RILPVGPLLLRCYGTTSTHVQTGLSDPLLPTRIKPSRRSSQALANRLCAPQNMPELRVRRPSPIASRPRSSGTSATRDQPHSPLRLPLVRRQSCRPRRSCSEVFVRQPTAATPAPSPAPACPGRYDRLAQGVTPERSAARTRPPPKRLRAWLAF